MSKSSNPSQLIEILSLLATGQSVPAIALALNMTKGQVKNRIQRARAAGETVEKLRAQLAFDQGGPLLTKAGPLATPKRKAPSQVGHSLAEFRATHDIGAILEAGIAKHLPEDGDVWFHDSDFRALLNVPVINWRRHADQFPQWQFRKGKFHAWAPRPMIAQFQNMTGHTG